MCHSIYRHAKANNKYMKDYDQNKESSYIQYWDVNNLYGMAMSQKLPVNNFEWIKDTFQFNEDCIKNYNEESDEGYFFEVDVQCFEKLHELHNDLPFLPERMKIEKGKKLAANLHDKTGYVVYIKFNQNVWLKPYFDMNTSLTKKAKNVFKKDFFKTLFSMNNAKFAKTIESLIKRRNIKLVTSERKRNYLVAQSNYTTKIFTENLLPIEIKKTEILMNKPVHLGLLILQLKLVSTIFHYF